MIAQGIKLCPSYATLDHDPGGIPCIGILGETLTKAEVAYVVGLC